MWGKKDKTRAVIRETSRVPKITLKELISSSAEIGGFVHRITINCTELGFRKETQEKDID